METRAIYETRSLLNNRFQPFTVSWLLFLFYSPGIIPAQTHADEPERPASEGEKIFPLAEGVRGPEMKTRK